MGFFTGILIVFSYERSEPLAATLQDRSVVLPVIMASAEQRLKKDSSMCETGLPARQTLDSTLNGGTWQRTDYFTGILPVCESERSEPLATIVHIK